MTIHQQIETLRANVTKLSANDQNFATSLVNQFSARGFLSPKQEKWIGILADRATGTKSEAVQIGSLTGIIALFDRAKKHLKFPAIVLSVPGFKAVRINVAGDRARFPGSLNVTDSERPNDPEARRTWFGRVHLDGKYEPSNDAGEYGPAIAVRLQAFSERPAEVAAEHGRLTGHCCFCNKQLTDERSTAVGYGGTCAKHYGLPWGAKVAAPVLTAANDDNAEREFRQEALGSF